MVKVNWDIPDIKYQRSEVAYTADHAAIVHEGFTNDSGDYPARPWIFTYVEEHGDDAPTVFLKNLKNGDIAKAFRGYSYDIADEVNATLEDVRWSWPRNTQTQARGVKGTTREISDTEELADSQEVRFE